ncbi:MAG TPA: hypothetical protein VMY78_15575 [Solirubrobacteraceae bacterium]|nr:hypothetical protein [Solirubrobacteraceae bacterium]
MLVVVAVVLLYGPAVAGAAISPLTIDTPKTALVESKTGGFTADVAVTNLTLKAIALTAVTDNAPLGCVLALDQNRSALAASTTKFKVTIPAACKADKTFAFEISGPAAEAAVPLAVTASAKKDEKKPNWDVLLIGYVGGLLVMLIVVIGVFSAWSSGDPERRGSTPLPSLPDTWSFKDSWASNITVGGGLLVGIFGSSTTLKGVLGDDADTSLALSTVGAAVSVALISAAGLLALSFQDRDTGNFTANGVLAGSFLALAGAAGQLFVVAEAARDLDLGGLEDAAFVAALLAELLLIFYGVKSVRSVLEQGVTPQDRGQLPGGSEIELTLTENLVVPVRPRMRDAPRRQRSVLP